MRIPDQCYEQRGHTGERLVCKEHGRKITFQKARGRTADKIRIDGCVPTPGRACDYLVQDWLGRRHFVELKGRDVEGAIDQIEQTLRHFRVNREEVFWCFVVCSSSPPNSLPGAQTRKARLRNTWKHLDLVVRTEEHVHPLTGGDAERTPAR